MIAIVPDYRLEPDLYAEFIEFLREVEGIRVLEIRGEQFGADGDNLGDHNQVSQPISLSVCRCQGQVK
jgi:hypothetical protein